MNFFLPMPCSTAQTVPTRCVRGGADQCLEDFQELVSEVNGDVVGHIDIKENRVG